MLAAGAALHYAYLLSKGETRAVIKTDEGEMRCCVSRVPFLITAFSGMFCTLAVLCMQDRPKEYKDLYMLGQHP
jgi:hypothetical protein